MNKEAREQYMQTLRERYLKANRKEKTNILDEYCRNTGQDRKYSIKKFRYKVRLKNPEDRKKKKEVYDNSVKPALARVWEIFDFPCGQRLQPMIKDELQRLRNFNEVSCSDAVAEKLKQMGTATIDRKLKHQKEVLMLGQKYIKKNTSTILNLIPIKTAAEFDRNKVGFSQIDCVEHNGSSCSGEYVNSLCFVDVCLGWWEAEAVMGRGQTGSLEAIDNIKERLPYLLLGIHPDNQSNFINYHALEYANKNGLDFSRSRPYKKNDNCFVEQKNSTHVRKVFGYVRYDTEEEMNIINDLYRGDLRLYKNFFQPVMKLVSKVRIKGRIYRKYDEAKTPFKRLLESGQISREKSEELIKLYESLNPAQLKRNIDEKLFCLFQIYQRKNGLSPVPTGKKLKPSMVSFYMTQPS